MTVLLKPSVQRVRGLRIPRGFAEHNPPETTSNPMFQQGNIWSLAHLGQSLKWQEHVVGHDDDRLLSVASNTLSRSDLGLLLTNHYRLSE